MTNKVISDNNCKHCPLFDSTKGIAYCNCAKYTERRAKFSSKLENVYQPKPGCPFVQIMKLEQERDRLKRVYEILKEGIFDLPCPSGAGWSMAHRIEPNSLVALCEKILKGMDIEDHELYLSSKPR